MGYGDTGLLFIVVPGILTSSLYCDHRLLNPHVYRIIILNFFVLTTCEDVEHEMFHVLLECKAETMCTIVYLFAFTS